MIRQRKSTFKVKKVKILLSRDKFGGVSVDFVEKGGKLEFCERTA
jgi:hypothetical protein